VKRHICVWLQSVAVCCGVLRCVAVCCSVLQCLACSALQCVAMPFRRNRPLTSEKTYMCVVAVCCGVLQCVAVCCLQCVAVCCRVFRRNRPHTDQCEKMYVCICILWLLNMCICTFTKKNRGRPVKRLRRHESLVCSHSMCMCVCV